MIGHPVLHFCKTRVDCQFRHSHYVAQNGKELVIARCNHYIAILGWKRVVRICRLIAIADALRNSSSGLINHCDVLHGGGHRVHQRHVDLFSQAGFLFVHQSGQHANCQIQRSQYVSHGCSGTGCRAVGPARGAHQSAHRLADNVIAGPLAQRSGVSETGHGSIDDAGIDFL